MIFGTFLQSPLHWYLISGRQENLLLVFWTLQELRDSEKGKLKEHVSEISRRIQQAEEGDQEPNRLREIGGGVAPYLGRATQGFGDGFVA